MASLSLIGALLVTGCGSGETKTKTVVKTVKEEPAATESKASTAGREDAGGVTVVAFGDVGLDGSVECQILDTEVVDEPAFTTQRNRDLEADELQLDDGWRFLRVDWKFTNNDKKGWHPNNILNYVIDGEGREYEAASLSNLLDFQGDEEQEEVPPLGTTETSNYFAVPASATIRGAKCFSAEQFDRYALMLFEGQE